MVTVIIASCGGGGGGDAGIPAQSSAPAIQAIVLSFDPGSNQGNIPNVSVRVNDSVTGADITNAVVTANGGSFAYIPGHHAYEGNLAVAAGAPVTVSVGIGTSTYVVSSTQFDSFPTISAPSSELWYNALPNDIAWAGTTATDAIYNLAILDAQDPYGVLVWPSTGSFQQLPVYTQDYRFAQSNPLPAGKRLIFTAIVKGTAIPGAASGSGLVVATCSTRPITIVDATVNSIVITPANVTLPWGTKQQFSATALFSDNSSVDVTQLASWSSPGLTLDYVNPGLATASYTGHGSVEAYLTGLPGSTSVVSGSTSVTVLAPRLQSILITPGNRTMVPGSIQHFTATGHYEDGTNNDITSSAVWSSSDEQVATISNAAGSSGQASSVAAGTAAISASLQGVSQSAALTSVPLPTYPGSYIYLQSDTGDYIGAGTNTAFTSNGSYQFSASAANGHLAVRIVTDQQYSQSGMGDFALPSSLTAFQPGYFGNLTRYEYPTIGGLSWSMNGRGCNALFGWFTVDNVTYSSGVLTGVDLHFAQHCENMSAPALYGWLRIQP